MACCLISCLSSLFYSGIIITKLALALKLPLTYQKIKKRLLNKLTVYCQAYYKNVLESRIPGVSNTYGNALHVVFHTKAQAHYINITIWKLTSIWHVAMLINLVNLGKPTDLVFPLRENLSLLDLVFPVAFLKAKGLSL